MTKLPPEPLIEKTTYSWNKLVEAKRPVKLGFRIKVRIKPGVDVSELQNLLHYGYQYSSYNEAFKLPVSYLAVLEPTSKSGVSYYWITTAIFNSDGSVNINKDWE